MHLSVQLVLVTTLLVICLRRNLAVTLLGCLLARRFAGVIATVITLAAAAAAAAAAVSTVISLISPSINPSCRSYYISPEGIYLED